MMMDNGYPGDFGVDYMEQEEEWEREGLLDPAWEKQQKKVSFSFYYVFHSLNLYFEYENLTPTTFSKKSQDSQGEEYFYLVMKQSEPIFVIFLS